MLRNRYQEISKLELRKKEGNTQKQAKNKKALKSGCDPGTRGKLVDLGGHSGDR